MSLKQLWNSFKTVLKLFFCFLFQLFCFSFISHVRAAEIKLFCFSFISVSFTCAPCFRNMFYSKAWTFLPILVIVGQRNKNWQQFFEIQDGWCSILGFWGSIISNIGNVFYTEVLSFPLIMVNIFWESHFYGVQWLGNCSDFIKFNMMDVAIMENARPVNLQNEIWFRS